MKTLVIPKGNKKYNCDGYILPLKNYSVNYEYYFSIDQIKDFDKEVFVVINKIFLNNELKDLEKTIIELSKLNIKGILFYDMAVLKIVKDNDLVIDLVWNEEHIVNNYNTCNYFYDLGCKYAYLSSDITIHEMLEINKMSKITSIILILGKIPVAHSRRKLVTNYLENNKKEIKDKVIIKERLTKQEYVVKEDENGTFFSLNIITNGLKYLEELKNNNFPYIVLEEDEYDLNNILELINKNNYKELNKIDIGQDMFKNKTYFQVKKNG